MASEFKKSSKGQLWRGEQEHAPSAEFVAEQHREFAPGADELEVDSVSRRQFMGLMGTSMAAAGTLMTGCVRKPQERIVPHTERPEDLIPGKPTYFRTAMNVGSRVIGLQVESQDGRPTKVEGNPDHPMSFGATDTWAQASVLGLYDQDRGKKVHRNGNPSSWSEFSRSLKDSLANAGTGGSMALVIDGTPSASRARLLEGVKARFPDARLYRHDPMYRANEAAGMAMLGATNATPVYHLDNARVIVSIDADFLGTDGDAVRNSRHFAAGRKVRTSQDTMNRVYLAEGVLSTTGLNADERLAVPSTECGGLLLGIAHRLLETLRLDPQVKSAIQTALMAQAYVAWTNPRAVVGSEEAKTRAATRWERTKAWLEAVSADAAAGGGVAFLVGERQPAWVHALGAALNLGLNGGDGTAAIDGGRAPIVRYVVDTTRTPAQDISAFVDRASRGEIKTALFLECNPALTAPANLNFDSAMGRVETAIQVASHLDETAASLSAQVRTAWYLPAAHFLESWGDLRASDGTFSIQQPLIAPLFEAISVNELLAVLAAVPGQAEALEAGTRDAGYTVLRAHWHAENGGTLQDNAWKDALFKGVVDGIPTRAARINGATFAQAFVTASPQPHPSGAIEVNFIVDSAVADGRFGNNGWLQEWPDPTTKLTWDNAALMSPATARAIGVRSGFKGGSTFVSDMVDIKVFDTTLRIAVYTVPGMSDDVVALPLGYGRGKTVGQIAFGAGFDAYSLRNAEGLSWIATAAGHLQKADSDPYPLATTQEHASLAPGHGYEERDIVEYMSFEAYQADPQAIVHKFEAKDHHEAEYGLFDPSVHFDNGQRTQQQWAMVIDLTTCTGCSACVMACNTENNIPVVGKDRVLSGREMHWIRIDRFYSGSLDDPSEVVVKPIMCGHCETAPCETVCPVAATQHSPDGLNDMAYNRCIGTRYCANNCPYKVRRFNFFNFQKENDEVNALTQLQRNPDVSVRFRGVMEKCTYCVQRITEARIVAKREGNGLIPQGGVVTACQQACPTQAISFGDMRNPETEVAQLRDNERNYELLKDLNLRPRTTFLARLRNANPALRPNEEEHAASDAEESGH